jgi:hypothetical protein
MKKRGRPSKNGVKNGTWHMRTLMVMYAYDEARTSGLKHSAAVREAVAFVRQLHPEMSISETEVKRVLTELRPSDSPVALRSDYEILQGEEAARLRRIFAQMLAPTGSKSPSGLRNQDPARPLRRFSVGYVKRPIYPRHNAKDPNS